MSDTVIIVYLIVMVLICLIGVIGTIITTLIISYKAERIADKAIKRNKLK